MCWYFFTSAAPDSSMKAARATVMMSACPAASAIVVRPRRRAKISDQRMNGVVTVQFGLLERQQVVLFDEHLDAALETFERHAGDQDVIEPLDQHGSRGIGRQRRKAERRIVSASVITPLILPTTVLSVCTAVNASAGTRALSRSVRISAAWL
jgi:hypothetical protein